MFAVFLNSSQRHTIAMRTAHWPGCTTKAGYTQKNQGIA